MIAGLSGRVVCGTALTASCTDLNCPLPSAATTSLVCAATLQVAATTQASQLNKIAIACGKDFIWCRESGIFPRNPIALVSDNPWQRERGQARLPDLEILHVDYFRPPLKAFNQNLD